ncbi:MAG: hypothetical protein RL065_1119 [Bacteroidota bacterium]
MIKIRNQKKSNKQEFDSQSQKKFTYLPLLFLLAIITGVFILYWQTLSFDFTNLDDNIFIKKGDNEILSFNEIINSFLKGCFAEKDAYYRPLLMIYFKTMNHYFTDNLLETYHFVNILIHCLNILLLFYFLKSINQNRTTNLILVALFALHPTFTMAVAWIPGINDLLLTTFALLFFISTNKFIYKFNLLHALIASLSFLFALFIKETGIFLPLICFILVTKNFDFKPFLKPKVIAFLSVILFEILLWYFLREGVLDKASKNVITQNWFTVLPHRLVSLFHYSSKALVPINLCVYPVFEVGRITTDIFITLTFIVLLFGLLFKMKSKEGMYFTFVGLIWFGILLTPILFMPAAAKPILFEHRLYLPFIGILICLLLPLNFLVDRLNSLTIGGFFLILIFYAFKVNAYVPYFSNSFEFCRNGAEFSPSSSRAQLNFGKALAEKNEMDSAIEYIKLSLKIDSKMHYSRYYLALYKYIPNQKYDSALFFLHQELNFTPEFPNNYLEISRCYLFKKDYPNSEHYLEKYRGLLPIDDRIATIMIQLYIQNNHFKKAKSYSDSMLKKSVVIDTTLIKLINQGLSKNHQ